MRRPFSSFLFLSAFPSCRCGAVAISARWTHQQHKRRLSLSELAQEISNLGNSGGASVDAAEGRNPFSSNQDSGSFVPSPFPLASPYTSPRSQHYAEALQDLTPELLSMELVFRARGRHSEFPLVLLREVGRRIDCMRQSYVRRHENSLGEAALSDESFFASEAIAVPPYDPALANRHTQWQRLKAFSSPLQQQQQQHSTSTLPPSSASSSLSAGTAVEEEPHRAPHPAVSNHIIHNHNRPIVCAPRSDALPLHEINLISIVRLLSRFDNGATVEECEVVEQGTQWMPRLRGRVVKWLRCQSAELSVRHSVFALHFLSRWSEGYDDTTLWTLRDNLLHALYCKPETLLSSENNHKDGSSCGAAVAVVGHDHQPSSSSLEELLSPLSIGANLAQQHNSTAKAATFASLLSLLLDAILSFAMTVRNGHNAVSSRSVSVSSWALLCEKQAHPIACPVLFHTVAECLTRSIACHEDLLVSSNTQQADFFFVLRTLQKAPWVHNPCISMVLPTLRPRLMHDPSCQLAVIGLLGRPDVTVTDALAVDTLLEILKRDLELQKDGREEEEEGNQKQNLSRPRTLRLGHVDLARVASVLSDIGHMLQVALTHLSNDIAAMKAAPVEEEEGGGPPSSILSSSSPVSRSLLSTPRPSSAPRPAITTTDTASMTRMQQLAKAQQRKRLLQQKSKEVYTLLCDNTLSVVRQPSDILRLPLVDHTLHHLLCLAPRELAHHPFVHLLFAGLLCLLPTIVKRRLHDSTKVRLLTTVLKGEEVGLYHTANGTLRETSHEQARRLIEELNVSQHSEQSRTIIIAWKQEHNL